MTMNERETYLYQNPHYRRVVELMEKIHSSLIHTAPEAVTHKYYLLAEKYGDYFEFSEHCEVCSELCQHHRFDGVCCFEKEHQYQLFPEVLSKNWAPCALCIMRQFEFADKIVTSVGGLNRIQWEMTDDHRTVINRALQNQDYHDRMRELEKIIQTIITGQVRELASALRSIARNTHPADLVAPRESRPAVGEVKEAQSRFEQVRKFHRKFGAPDRTDQGLSLIPAEEHRFRYDLMTDEVHEYSTAAERNNLVGVLDAVVDILYTTYGTAIQHGITEELLDAAFAEVQRSNMSKEPSDPPGGKAVKGENYTPPNLKPILDRFERTEF